MRRPALDALAQQLGHGAPQYMRVPELRQWIYLRERRADLRL